MITPPQVLIVNGTEVEVEMFENGQGAYARVGGQQFSMGGSDPERIAEFAWRAANPKPSPERVEAMRLAEKRGEKVCERCGGHGGWRGWPGFTCHECNGRRTIVI